MKLKGVNHFLKFSNIFGKIKIIFKLIIIFILTKH
jgi:hypothetical protein